mgnify:CR=1 FL=1
MGISLPKGSPSQDADSSSLQTVRVPLTTQQLVWVSKKAKKYGLSRAAFLHLLITRYKAAETLSEAVVSSGPKSDRSQEKIPASPDASPQSDSASDTSSSPDDTKAPTSIFDYVDDE